MLGAEAIFLVHLTKPPKEAAKSLGLDKRPSMKRRDVF